MIDPDDDEIRIMHKILVPLGEYIAEIGENKTFKELNKQQVITIIDIIITNYLNEALNSKIQVR